MTKQYIEKRIKKLKIDLQLAEDKQEERAIKITIRDLENKLKTAI